MDLVRKMMAGMIPGLSQPKAPYLMTASLFNNPFLREFGNPEDMDNSMIPPLFKGFY